MFELRRDKTSGSAEVRVYYVSQSMEQMRAGNTLTLDALPKKVPLYPIAASPPQAKTDNAAAEGFFGMIKR